MFANHDVVRIRMERTVVEYGSSVHCGLFECAGPHGVRHVDDRCHVDCKSTLCRGRLSDTMSQFPGTSWFNQLALHAPLDAPISGRYSRGDATLSESKHAPLCLSHF